MIRMSAFGHQYTQVVMLVYIRTLSHSVLIYIINTISIGFPSENIVTVTALCSFHNSTRVGCTLSQ